MPFFRTTKNIFVDPWNDELYNENDLNLNKVFNKKWDYKRDMKIEDVDIWEQIYLESGGTGLYAAWSPYAEFYLITNKIYYNCCENSIETFYGPGSGQKAYKKAIEMGMNIKLNKVWVDNSDMWLYNLID
jgi:hypothetical protein